MPRAGMKKPRFRGFHEALSRPYLHTAPILEKLYLFA